MRTTLAELQNLQRMFQSVIDARMSVRPAQTWASWSGGQWRELDVNITGTITDGATLDGLLAAIAEARAGVALTVGNCNGGDFGAAAALVLALTVAHGGTRANISGSICSSATLVARACRTVSIKPGASVGLHAATLGNGTVSRHDIQAQSRATREIADFFRHKLGDKFASVEHCFRSEAVSWFSAEAAVEAGLADSIS